jgi:ATP-dependent Clp protease ATP-binding subunit ClpA
MGEAAERLEADLRQRVVGQDDAIAQIVDVYQTYRVGLTNPGRTIANLLFLGPTGSGKTHLVEATAESLVGDSKAVIKIDCAEFQHSHEIAKLVGSPPGYLGHRETQAGLSQEVLNQHHTAAVKISLVLFDEIEKASDALWKLMLGIMDKATLTLGDNRKVDFSKTIVFMTSNLGAKEMEAHLRPRLGFAAGEAERHRQSVGADAAVEGEMSAIGMAAARRNFPPEFINRIDKTVVFRPLGHSELRSILKLELQLVQRRVLEARPDAPFVLGLTAAGADFLQKSGTDVRYGARHLKRSVEQFVVRPLSNLIGSSQIHAGDVVRVDAHRDGTGLVFWREAKELSSLAMTQWVEEPDNMISGAQACTIAA